MPPAAPPDGALPVSPDSALPVSPDSALPAPPRTLDSEAPLFKFLMKDPVFQELEKLMVKGWENRQDDWYWKERKRFCQSANSDGRQAMFSMMQGVASQLDKATGAFTLTKDPDSDCGAVLDLALAPGGFASYALTQNPDCEVDGFTLPEEDGGHEVLVDCDPERLSITATDITNFMKELGVGPEEIPDGHPDAEALTNAEWPYSRERYGLVIAVGKPLSNPGETEKPFREVSCALRAAQIALALSKVRPGGTIVMLCFNSRRPRALRLLHELYKLSDSLQLFKPEPMHAVKSSFYVVCRGVHADSPECRELIARYVTSWRRAVFYPSHSGNEQHPDGSEGEIEPGLEQDQRRQAAGGSEDGDGSVNLGPVGDPWLDEVDIAKLIEEFGETYVALVRPTWEVQIRGMRRMWSKLESLRDKGAEDRLKAVSSQCWKGKRTSFEASYRGRGGGGGGSSWGGYANSRGGDYDHNNSRKWGRDSRGGGGGGRGGYQGRRSFGNERASERPMELGSWRKS